MDTPLNTIIAGEQAKIELLRAKIVECERRIEMLRAMQADDDIDAVLMRRLQASATSASSAKDAPNTAEKAFSRTALFVASSMAKVAAPPKKTLTGTTLKLLRYAEGADKSIDDFLAYADQNGIDKGRQGMRAFLHQYKAVYGLLDSDRAGHFRLSAAGADYLKSIEPAQGEATSAT